MDIRHLEAFSKVYEYGSFSKAGQALFVSQPTISAHIATLESELGVPLFDRLSRGILPTPAGNILYRKCAEIFAILAGTRAEIDMLSKKVTGDLHILASSIPSQYLLPQVLADFLTRYPDVRASIETGDSARAIEAVLLGKCALGVCGAVEEHPDLEYESFHEDKPVVLASVKLVPDKDGNFSLHDLVKLPWIVREPGSGTRKLMESAFRNAGLNMENLRISARVEGNLSVLQLIKAGLGVSVTSALAAGELVENGSAVILTVPELTFKRGFYLVWHRRREMFPVVKMFIRHILDFF